MSKHLMLFASLLAFSGQLYGETGPTTSKKLAAMKVHKARKQTKPKMASGEFDELRKYAEVLALIKEKSVRPFDIESFISESLKAAVPSTDAHSAFFVSLDKILESTSGKFSGIGVSIISKLPEDDNLIVVDVIGDGPAEKAGLRAQDSIVEVNGDKLRGLSSDEVVGKLKGETGTSVALKVLRDKKMLEFTVTRDTVKNEVSNFYHFPKQNIYYLSLRMFTDNAAKRVEELVGIAKKNNARGLIFDLRRNPGGVLDTAVDMAGLFVDKGEVVVYTKGRGGKVISEYKTTSEPILRTRMPIFMLVDNFTASASEILSGTLRHYSQLYAEDPTRKDDERLMVFVLGVKTFGKGSVQEVIPISKGSALKLTTMLYYLPNHESIQATGVQPDIVLHPKIGPTDEMKLVQSFHGNESSIKNHITRKEVDEFEGKSNPAADEAKEETKELTFEEKHIKSIKGDETVLAAARMISLLDQAPKKAVLTRPKALAYLQQHYVTEDDLDLQKVG